MIGQWEPKVDRGYNAHAMPWVLERSCAEFMGGRQQMLTADFRVRRFKSREAAQKVADSHNARTKK